MPSDSFDPTKKAENSRESSTLKKQQVLQQLIEKARAQLESLVGSRDRTREMAKDAPSANQSHSDTSKFQLSNVQLGLESVKIELEGAITRLQQMPINVCEKVMLGAIFTIHEISNKGEDKTYFLVSAGGGETLTVGNESITSITPGAPIARACLKKAEGDDFEFQGKEFEIIKII